MNPRKLTRAALLKWGGEDVYLQAETLVRKGAVLRADLQDDLLSGIVARESASPIYTKLRILAPDKITSLCPCYANQHNSQVCPHVVALGIALMLRHTDPLREQKYKEERRRARRIAQISPRAYLQRDPRGTPAQIALSLQPNWIQQFAAGRISLTLMLLTDQGPLLPDSIRPGSRFALSTADDNLLSVIEDICEGPPPTYIEVNPPDLLNIINIASHTRLIVAGKGELIVESIPMQTHLEITLDRDNGELIIFPYSELPHTREGELPTYLVSHNRGRILANNHLWPMASVLPLPYHPIYQQDEIVPRPRVINFLNNELPQLQRLIRVELELTPDLFTTIPGTPEFLLELVGSRASLRATLTARYDTFSIAAAAPETKGDLTIPDPDDLLSYHTRNLPLERQAVDLLTSLGFSPDRSYTTELTYTLIGSREVLNFLGAGYPTLRRSGWRTSLAPPLAKLLDSMPVVTPVVEITDTNNEWFEVGYTFDLPGRGEIPSTEIQRAIQHNNGFFDYHGETILLDSPAVNAMRNIFTDCYTTPSTTPGNFRLPKVYAPFVHSSLQSLDGIDVEDPPDWRQQAAASNRTGPARFKPIPLGPLDQTLRPYQKEGVYWLRFIEESGLAGILADEMGLGKTLQTLTWLSLTRTNPDARSLPALIVCPTSLVENWRREAEKFVPHLKTLAISGPQREALWQQAPEQDLIITSYALLRRDLEICRAQRFAVAVLDEAQHIKNRSTQNAIAAKQIPASNRLVLTGTPIENSVADLWSIMDFLMPDYLGKYESFRHNYELPIASGERQGELAQEKLRRKLHPFLLRRLKRDVAKDLPDKIVKVSYCTLTPDQQRVYNNILSEARHTIGELVRDKGFERSRFEILAMLMRLRQTCCHLDLLKDRRHTTGATAPSAKLDAFMELLDEAIDGGHRILVFSQFVGMLKLLRATLDEHNIDYCYLDGSTQDRLEQCQRFNLTPSIPLFLISLKAGGTGLNLTGADMVIHFDPWWNPAVEDQATDRAHRIGQKRTVYSIKLIAEHTIEEKVLAMQQHKQSIISATIATTDDSVMQKLTFDDIRTLIGL